MPTVPVSKVAPMPGMQPDEDHLLMAGAVMEELGIFERMEQEMGGIKAGLGKPSYEEGEVIPEKEEINHQGGDILELDPKNQSRYRGREMPMKQLPKKEEEA